LTIVRWIGAIAICVVILGYPLLHFRMIYAEYKRLRIVEDGKFYRSGQATASGLRDIIEKYHIKTVINLQDENVDPILGHGYFGKKDQRESEVCRDAGAKYLLLSFDLVPRNQIGLNRPAVLDHFLQVMDDPKNYPVLLHCKAGLHRTGELTAVYRMEYGNWPLAAATRELMANGFGDSGATTANDYMVQLLETFRPGIRRLPVCPATDLLGGSMTRALPGLIAHRTIAEPTR
jgi:tyrosine-protein phosphatase SIW14